MTVFNIIQLLVAAMCDVRSLFAVAGSLSSFTTNDNVNDMLYMIDLVSDIPLQLKVGWADFELMTIANQVSKVIQKWTDLKGIVEKAQSGNAVEARFKLTASQKSSFLNDPSVKKLLDKDTGVADQVIQAFGALNKRMWTSEFHILFLGFRHQYGGRFPIELWKGLKADIQAGPSILYDKGHSEFLAIFTSEYVGCIYKLMAHFIFNRPISRSFKAKDMLELLSDGDTSRYISLAELHIKKGFTKNDEIERNFNYLRMFVKAFHQG